MATVHKPTIPECVNKLTEAREEFDRVKAQKDHIDREMTRCTNNLNAAQKIFDEAVAELKKDAPWNTEWSAPARRASAVTVS